MDGVFCQTNQLLLGGGLGINEGFVHIDACPNLSQLVDECCYVSPFPLCQSYISWHSQKDMSSSLKQASRISDITLELLDLNPLKVVCNKNIRPWKVLLQLMSKPNLDVFCHRYHNYMRKQNQIDVPVIGESKLDNLIKDVNIQKSPVCNLDVQSTSP